MKSKEAIDLVDKTHLSLDDVSHDVLLQNTLHK